MSIEQLTKDLKEMIDSAAQPGVLDAMDGPKLFLQQQLLPFLQSLVEEVDEIDSSVEDVITQSVDVIHRTTATNLIAVIEGAALLIGELKTRAADDRRIQASIRQWTDLAAEAKEYISDVTVEDPDEDEDEDEDEETPADGEAPKEGAKPAEGSPT